MPAKSINLLSKVDFEKTPVGKFLRWSLTYGRYIIICTEIVVLLAFIYRFSLDRKITDLNDEIKQKSAIIAANSDFENQFRYLQNRLEQVGKLNGENSTVLILKHLEQITPPGIVYKTFAFSQTTISISATADTNASLAVYVAKLKSSPLLTNVSIGGVSKKNTGTAEILFGVNANLKSQGEALSQSN